MRAVIDTSVFIALESGRAAAELPEPCAVSVATLAELHVGVLRAKDAESRAKRLRTLAFAEREFETLPIDTETARTFASIASEARAKGRRPKTMDVWIAATALRHGAVLVTQDRDFDAMQAVEVMRI